MQGFLLINKEKDWTSHDVVGYIRKIIREQNKKAGLPAKTKFGVKVGHAGTLDPFATGLLIVGVGREATRKLDDFKNLPKTYIATLKFGFVSDTYDSTGKIEAYKHLNHSNYPLAIKENKITETLQSFIGKQKQLPPMYSAKKVDGKKLYELARKGIEIERKPHEIEIFKIELLEYEWPKLKIKIDCSTGTYIRTLVHDIGQKLDVGAYCDELERTRIGEHLLKDAVNVKDINLED